MKKDNSRVTIRDVAARANVSISTVSRVIHGNYYVNPEICEQVKQAIEDLDYVPDSNARSMKLRYRYMIGYLVSDISNRHFTVIGRALEDVIRPPGYSLNVCSNDSMEDKEMESLRALMSHRIDGLIINTSGKNDEYIGRIAQKTPMVLLHRTIDIKGFHGDLVGSDDYAGGAQLARRLIECGHERIGIIGSDPTISTFRNRLNGLRDYLDDAGLKLSESRLVIENYTQDGGYSATKRLLDQAPEISAVAVINNAMAVGVYTFLGEVNVSIPDRISVISFGEIENAGLFRVKPTFISQQPALIGQAAGKLLLSRIKDPSLEPRTTIIPTIYELGDSVCSI